MQTIKIPVNTNFNFQSISKMLNQIASITKIDSEICFDFSEVSWFSAELTTFLGVEFKYLFDKDFKLYVTGLHGQILTILEKNGFLHKFHVGKKIPDFNHTTIPFEIIHSDDVEKINSYLTTSVFPKTKLGISNDLIKNFKSIVFEITDNTKQHSKSSNVLMCGQWFPRKNELTFTIADDGITIPKKIESSIPLDFTKDTDYIEWATELGTSTKTHLEAGLGLFDLKSTMAECGELSILSRNGFWKMTSSGTIISHTLKNKFHGTLIHMNFLLNLKHTDDIEKNHMDDIELTF